MDARAAVLAWYRPRRRAYPWRRPCPDPYHVLVSEVMLQQTQVARVVPAFRSFLARFPTVSALAEAPRSDVLRAWEGLGYNRRAVNLSKAARDVIRDHGGRIPCEPEALIGLPGVGPYTAAAVASVAFAVPVPALDTNAQRVTARVLFGLDRPDVPQRRLREAAERWIDRDDPGSWNQALMDLGREICRPAPRCGACPLARWCGYPPPMRRPPARGRSRDRFEGSTRQVRGAIVRLLSRSPATFRELVRATGGDGDRTLRAVRSLAEDGIVAAGPEGLSGSPHGKIRLAD